MSFIEWTAMSIPSWIIASSISRVKSPLPPSSFSSRSCTRSPVVWITCTSKASRGRSKAVISRLRVSWACASASGEPRVPMRRGAEGVGRSRVMPSC
jgi:hypothetical protein